MSDEEIQSVKNKYTDEFTSQAIQGVLVYRRQMIVIASTICEAMILDFLKSHFANHPEKMFNYVSDDGRVNFRLVIKHETREEMLQFFASIAAKQFVGRKWKEVFKQLETILKTKFQNTEALLGMLLLRNEIIHEAAKPEISNEKLYDFFYAVQDLNEKLYSISKQVKT